MRYKKMGRTGLKVSAFCLGTVTFGMQTDEAEAIKMTERAMDAGVNFFDSADRYNEGKSEQILGKALKGKRYSVVLATKVAQRMSPDINDIGLSRRYIMNAVEASLRRLQTDYIDLYYVHQPDYDTPIDETLRAMDDLVHQGKVRYIGCSSFRAWQLCKALWVSDRYNLTRFDAIQPPYNLITRDIEYELLPLCTEEGVGVCVYNTLAGGLLSGKHDPTKPPPAGTRFTLPELGVIYQKRYWSNLNFEAVKRYQKIANEHGRTLPEFVVAWMVNQETITSAICGASTVQQLDQTINGADIVLSEEELAACDKVRDELKPVNFFYGKFREDLR